MKWGRDTGAYAMFAKYLTRGVWWCLVASLATLAMFLPDFGRPTAWHRLAFCGWLGSTAGAGVAVVRVLLILASVLHQAATEPKS
jgi:hypothetical protein